MKERCKIETDAIKKKYERMKEKLKRINEKYKKMKDLICCLNSKLAEKSAMVEKCNNILKNVEAERDDLKHRIKTNCPDDKNNVEFYTKIRLLYRSVRNIFLKSINYKDGDCTNIIVYKNIEDGEILNIINMIENMISAIVKESNSENISVLNRLKDLNKDLTIFLQKIPSEKCECNIISSTEQAPVPALAPVTFSHMQYYDDLYSTINISISMMRKIIDWYADKYKQCERCKYISQDDNHSDSFHGHVKLEKLPQQCTSKKTLIENKIIDAIREHVCNDDCRSNDPSNICEHANSEYKINDTMIH